MDMRRLGLKDGEDGNLRAPIAIYGAICIP